MVKRPRLLPAHRARFLAGYLVVGVAALSVGAGSLWWTLGSGSGCLLPACRDTIPTDESLSSAWITTELFVKDVILNRSPTCGFDLSTRRLRDGRPREAWNRGGSPVQRFATRYPPVSIKRASRDPAARQAVYILSRRTAEIVVIGANGRPTIPMLVGLAAPDAGSGAYRILLVIEKSSPSSGTGRSSSSRRRCRSRFATPGSTRSCCTPGSTTTPSCRRSSSTSSASPSPPTGSTCTAPTRRRCSRGSSTRSSASGPTGRSSTATRTRRSRARAPRSRPAFGSRTSRRACAAATCRCRRSTTGSRSTASPISCSRPDERSRDTLAAEGVGGRVEVVGDVMRDALDLFAPIARERSRARTRGAHARAATSSARCTARRTSGPSGSRGSSRA